MTCRVALVGAHSSCLDARRSDEEMPQGDKKLKKPDRKTKTVRGDQQKLRKGSASLPLRATRVRSTV